MMNVIAALVGRIMLSLIFIVSGVMKLFSPAATEAMIVKAGLPPGLAIPVGIFELVAGLAIALGFMTRLASILLAAFCLLAALFFHRDFTDPMQAANFMKNVAIAGGLLCLFAHSQMRSSYDTMTLTRKAEIAERDGVVKAHEAEVRAAAAEGRAEALRSMPVAAPIAATPVVAAPLAAAPLATAPIHDQNRDGVDDRIQRDAGSTRHDLNADGIDDRIEPIDPRLRP